MDSRHLILPLNKLAALTIPKIFSSILNQAADWVLMVFQEQYCLCRTMRCCPGCQFLCSYICTDMLWPGGLCCSCFSLSCLGLYTNGLPTFCMAYTAFSSLFLAVSGSVQLRQLPELLVVWFALGWEECWVLQDKYFLFFPLYKGTPAFPKQCALSMQLRLPFSCVDVMVWSGTTYSSGYCEVMFEIYDSFLTQRCL